MLAVTKLLFSKKRLCAYLQTLHHRDRCDRCGDGAHSLIKRVFCLVSANDSPGSTIVNNLLVGLFGACWSLKNKQITT